MNFLYLKQAQSTLNSSVIPKGKCLTDHIHYFWRNTLYFTPNQAPKFEIYPDICRSLSHFHMYNISHIFLGYQHLYAKTTTNHHNI